MMADQRSPWWPYLFVLGLLFVLSVAVPRGWQAAVHQHDPNERWHQQTYLYSMPIDCAADAVLSETAALVKRTNDRGAAQTVSSDWHPAAKTTAVNRSVLALSLDNPLVEAVSQKIADFRRFSAANASSYGNVTSANQSSPKIAIKSVVAESQRTVKAAQDLNTANTKQHADSSTVAASTWPMPQARFAQLDKMSYSPQGRVWADEVKPLCRDLCRSAGNDPSREAEILEKLNALDRQGGAIVDALKDSDSAADFRRARWSLERRLLLWTVALTAEPITKPIADGVASSDDIRELIGALELYESSGLPSDARRAMAIGQRLNAWTQSNEHQLAEYLEQIYRNANVRLTVSAELLNRLAPDMPPTPGTVDDTILGRPVRGTSTTTAQMHVQLVPDMARLHLFFEAQGQVDSQTQSVGRSATLTNHGQSAYEVRKEIIVAPERILVGSAIASANTNSELDGVNTRFDNMPLLGQAARNRVVSRYDALSDEARREVEQHVAARASSRTDEEVDRRVEKLEADLRSRVIEPLEKMDLDPKPIALQTTADRLTMRTRLAGENQLGGHTARPQAPSDSLASLQIHQSALNNALDQLLLSGRTFTPAELYAHVAEREPAEHDAARRFT